VRRRLLWLMVLGAAVAVAVVYRVRARTSTHVRETGDAWRDFGAADVRPTYSGHAPAQERRHGEEDPTEGPAMVVATMEAAPAPVGTSFDHNGSITVVGEPEPTKAGSEAALGSIELGPVKLPSRRRRSGATLAALGALAGVGAIALGAWGVASNLSSDDSSSATTPAALENVPQIVSLISKPTSVRIPLQGSGQRIILVVGARGYGVLVLNGLAAPPAGKTYQAWVIRPNKTPKSAGIFAGGTGVVIPLTTPVPPGAVVAITVEKAGGAPAPTQTPKLVATRT
jgi:hypothetical protein